MRDQMPVNLYFYNLKKEDIKNMAAFPPDTLCLMLLCGTDVLHLEAPVLVN